MRLDQASLLYAELLLNVLNEIEDLNLSPDTRTASRGDLIAELFWIASRIRKIQSDMRSRPLTRRKAQVRCNAR